MLKNQPIVCLIYLGLISLPAYALVKTRPEFLDPAVPPARPIPTQSPEVLPQEANPTPPQMPDTNATDLGSQPIVPTLNTIPSTNRPEFQTPDPIRRN